MTVAVSETIASIWNLVSVVNVILTLLGNSLIAAVRSLRRQSSFDAAFLFPNSLRVALESWLSCIPRRIGYRGHSRSWLLNQIIPEPPRRGPLEHQSTRYLRIAQECGALTEKSLGKKTPDAQGSTLNAQLADSNQLSTIVD